MGVREKENKGSKPLISVFFGSPRSVISTKQPEFETKGKRVRFAKKSTLYISRSTALKEVDVTSLWYTEDEYRLFQRAFLFIVKLMDTQMKFLEEDEELCPRGLEAKTKVGVRKRKDAIEYAWDVVLAEHHSPTRTARLYHEAAASCTMEAFLRAKRDEQYVGKLNTDPVQHCG
jgi:hypothetical protein